MVAKAPLAQRIQGNGKCAVGQKATGRDHPTTHLKMQQLESGTAVHSGMHGLAWVLHLASRGLTKHAQLPKDSLQRALQLHQVMNES